MAHAVADIAGVSIETKEPERPILNWILKTNCKTTLCSEAVFPAMNDGAQHWGLSVALEGIAAYQNWVSGWLWPVAALWVYEHKAEICRSEGWPDLPDDVDKVIRAAFEFARKHDRFGDNFQVISKDDGSELKDVNPAWREASNAMCEEIRANCKYPDLSHGFGPNLTLKS